MHMLYSFSPAGEVAHEDVWRTHVQYLLSQNVSFKPHIFNPTKKFSNELRKQHFFVERRIPRLSILHKQQSFSPAPSWHSAKFGERSRDRDTISFASRYSASGGRGAKQNVGWKPGVSQNTLREKGRMGEGEETKAASMAAEECVACHPIFPAGRCALRFFAYLPLFRPTPFPIPSARRGTARRRQSA